MLERSEGVGDAGKLFEEKVWGRDAIFVQIVDEQDGGAVLSGRILPILAWEFCQQCQQMRRKGQ